MSLSSALRQFKRPTLWLGIWVFGWLLCITLSLIHPPQIDLQLPDGDKLGHFLAYATLSAWSVLIFEQGRVQRKAAISLFLLGIAMELAQGAFTNYRMMDATDVLANTLGVIFGQLLALTQAQTLLLRWDLHTSEQL